MQNPGLRRRANAAAGIIATATAILVLKNMPSYDVERGKLVTFDAYARILVASLGGSHARDFGRDPASADRDLFGNATLVHCGRVNYEQDLRLMANMLQVKLEELQALKPLQRLERNMQTGKLRRGILAS